MIVCVEFAMVLDIVMSHILASWTCIWLYRYNIYIHTWRGKDQQAF